MTNRKKFLFAGCGASAVAALVAIAILVGPARANKDPVTPEQLNAYNQVFLDEVKKGDLLFHGDDATQKQMGVKLTTSAMACAMCHPFASDTHPMSFPKFQVIASAGARPPTASRLANRCSQRLRGWQRMSDACQLTRQGILSPRLIKVFKI